MRLLPALLLVGLATPATPLFADCPEVARALFSTDIQEREPVTELSSLPDDGETLFFFIELHDGGGETLLVEWHSDNLDSVTVRLPVGGDRWRTWSSRNITGYADQPWRVILRTRSGCQLGEYRIGPATAEIADAEAELLPERPEEPSPERPPETTSELPPALLAAIQAGDLAGARGLLEESRQSMGDDPRLRRIEQVDLPLLQLANDIDAQRFYTAEARLEQLQEQLPPDDPARTTLDKLAARWQAGNRDLNQEITAQLNVLEKSIEQGLMGLLPCPEDHQQAAAHWQQINPGLDLLLTGYNRPSGPQLVLLDRRTGMSHGLLMTCLENDTAE